MFRRFRRRFLRNPEVQQVTLSQDVLEQRKNSFLAMMQRVREGVLPRKAIEEMYAAERVWQIQPLSQVLKNIMGKDYSLDPGELAALSEKGDQLRGIWSHRRAWLANLESRAVAIARQAQRSYDEDEDESSEEFSKPTYPKSIRVGLYAYNIWVYTGEDYFVPYLDHKRETHVGSNNLAEAEALLVKAIADDTLSALLPRKINARAYNVWELDPETGVWLPAVYKQERPGKPDRAVHLGHSDMKKAEKMAARWKELAKREVEILGEDEEPPHIPAFRYRPRGGSWLPED
jgi:hypothetical protein